MGAVNLRAALGLCALCGCGARAGIDVEDHTPWRFDGGDTPARVELDASVDRALMRPPRLEAGCTGETLPSPREVRAVMAPTRLGPMVLHDPTRQRALVVGGLPSSGRSTREVYAVSTTDGRPRPLGSSAVDLPVYTGLAWIDPPRTAIIVGGTHLGGMWTSRVLRVSVEEDSVQFSPAGEHPGGAVSGVAAVYDPLRGGVIVQGGEAIDTADARPVRATWLVRWVGGETRWERIVSDAESPPLASGRIGGVDPRTGAVVLIGGFTRQGYERAVWSLSPGPRPRWTRLDGAADALPRSGDSLSWDPVACGFLVVGGRCADQVWLLRPEGDGVREALLGTVRTNDETVGTGRLGAGVVFDPAIRTLVMIAGTNCQMSGFTVPSNVVMDLR